MKIVYIYIYIVVVVIVVVVVVYFTYYVTCIYVFFHR